MSKNLYCFVGESGAGKDTLVNTLCEKYGYTKVKSYTTRPQRDDPNDIHNHTFVTLDDYTKDKKENIIVASTYFDDKYYWTTYQMLDDIDFYIIDLKGLKELKEKYKNKPIISIVVKTDENVRIKRMLERGDSNANIMQRVSNDTKMFEEISEYEFDIYVNNNGDNNIDQICDDLHNTIQAKEGE